LKLYSDEDEEERIVNLLIFIFNLVIAITQGTLGHKVYFSLPNTPSKNK
jgi:hypothetical protein